MVHLGYGIYYISDKRAGSLARATERGKLPKWGYELKVMLPDGPAWLRRTTLILTDPVKRKGKRNWVWSVIPVSR